MRAGRPGRARALEARPTGRSRADLATRIVGAQQLLDEHRVAGRALEQAVHHRGRLPFPEQGGDLVGDLGPVEPMHVDPIEPPAVGDRQRVDQVGLVVAGRGDDGQRDGACAA